MKRPVLMHINKFQFDESASVRCELEGQMRSLDFTLLQLRTELQMERHRSSALSDETSNLHKKVSSLLQYTVFSLIYYILFKWLFVSGLAFVSDGDRNNTNVGIKH